MKYILTKEVEFSLTERPPISFCKLLMEFVLTSTVTTNRNGIGHG
jgi:hypothetical protein